MAVELSTCELGDVAELFDSLHQTPQYIDQGYPMIRVTDIRRGYVETATAVRVNEETYLQFSKKHKPLVGDILFSRVGSYGNSAYVMQNEKFCLGQNTVCISPNRQLIEPTFLYCALNSADLRNQIESFVGGASQGTISLKSIRKLEVPCPPLPIQQRIASILSAYDELIENSQRRIKILEAMARGLYREWFVHFRFPGHESHPRVASALGEIPQGWAVKTVDSFCPFVSRGVTPKYEAGSGRFVINQKVNRGTVLSLDDMKELESALEISPEKMARFGDVLVNCLGEGTIGRVHFYSEPHLDWAVDQHMSICRATTSAHSLYVYFALESNEGQDRIASLKTGGTNMTMFNISALRSFALTAPPPKLLSRFSELAMPMLSQKQALTELTRNLRKTRDLLLPRLLSGQIEVEVT